MDDDPGHTPARTRPRGDHGGVVLGWLTKLVVVMAVVGVLLFDGLSIVSSRVSIEDQGTLAAREASAQYQRSGDAQLAYNDAMTAATEANALNEIPPGGFVTSSDGTVSLQIRREATTFVVHRIDWIEDWAVVSTQTQAKDMG